MNDALPTIPRHRPPCTDGEHCGEAAHCPPLPALDGVLVEVQAERANQDAKWGEQNHPDGTGPDRMFTVAERLGRTVVVIGREFANAARRACDSAHLAGDGTWAHILLEEVGEAFAEQDPDALRVELLQVAAVASAWAEAIDRREVQA